VAYDRGGARGPGEYNHAMIARHRRSCALFALALVVAAPAATSGLRRSPVVAAVEKIAPAVVNIAAAERDTPDQDPFGLVDPFADEYFRDFYHPSPRGQGAASLGSGLVVDGRGYVLTNEHVILRAARIKVLFADRREFEAQVIGTDPDSDIAVLKIDTPVKLQVATLGTSTDLMIGETVIAIGNPYGLSQTVTTGVVSAVDRSITSGNRQYADFVQTDASINPGNSGGPLVNIDGEVVGINTAIYNDARGIGFAIPIDRARRVMDDLMRYGSVLPAWIGVEVQALGGGTAGTLGLDHGVVVTHVYAKTPAAASGLGEGDILLSVEGQLLASPSDLDSALARRAAGSKLKFDVARGHNRRVVAVRALEGPSAILDGVAETLTGMKVKMRDGGGLVVTEVSERGRAAAQRLKAGDVLYEANGHKLATLDDYREAFFRALGAKSILLLVRRDTYGVYLPFSLR